MKTDDDLRGDGDQAEPPAPPSPRPQRSGGFKGFLATRDAKAATADGTDKPEPDRRISLYVLIGFIILIGAMGGWSTLFVIAAIIVMIFLHELGHYITAKSAGMKVTEFFIGFGPRIWSFRRGETEYGLKAIPAGAYVRIIGMHNLEEVAPEDEPRTYRQKPFWRRLSVAVAGSAVHFIIAIVLLFTLVSFVGLIRYDKPKLQVGEITQFTSGQSPAQLAGFRLGDKVVSVDGQAVAKWDDIPPYIRTHAGKQLTFVVLRNGQQVTLTPTPVDLRTVQLKGATGPSAAS